MLLNKSYVTQNELLLKNLLVFYNKTNTEEKKYNLNKMLAIINGDSQISLRIVDWFATNYAKKNYTLFTLKAGSRFKVYDDYKLKLKAYSKRRFDPFCRWDRINIPYDDNSHIQTTIGQLNFFKWALENEVITYIEQNYKEIEFDMNNRNTTTKRNQTQPVDTNKTRKKREELSVSATKSIKKEEVQIVVKFN